MQSQPHRSMVILQKMLLHLCFERIFTRLRSCSTCQGDKSPTCRCLSFPLFYLRILEWKYHHTHPTALKVRHRINTKALSVYFHTRILKLSFQSSSQFSFDISFLYSLSFVILLFSTNKSDFNLYLRVFIIQLDRHYCQTLFSCAFD